MLPIPVADPSNVADVADPSNVADVADVLTLHQNIGFMWFLLPMLPMLPTLSATEKTNYIKRYDMLLPMLPIVIRVI